MTVHVRFDEVHGFSDDFIGVAGVTRHVGHGEGGPLPRILMVHFRDGDFESRSDSLFQSLENVPLLLQRAKVRQVQLHHTQGDSRESHVGGKRTRSERACDFLGRIHLEDVPRLNATHPVDADSTLEARRHFANILLEPPE